MLKAAVRALGEARKPQEGMMAEQLGEEERVGIKGLSTELKGG